MKEVHTESGHCPYCQSSNVDYIDVEGECLQEGDCKYITYKCKVCQEEFLECHVLQYHSTLDIDGNLIMEE